MRDDTSAYIEMKRAMRRWGQWIIALFWLLQFAELTISSIAEEGAGAWRALLPRLIVLAIGVVLTQGLLEVAARAAGRPFRTRLLTVMSAAALICALLVSANLAIFYIAYTRSHVPFDLGEYLWAAFFWSWFFIALGGTLLALSYSLDVREREKRLADMRQIASNARMAALRHQLNPHFLFNTLNSIAALIEAHENRSAEMMVENLADFLRATLELDPLVDVSLHREVELQKLYLQIEEVRFPARLKARYDIPDDLADIRVPALISQPLVENAIRHGVARSSDPIEVLISAARQGRSLRMTVENGLSRTTKPAAPGTGVGLANVRARLEARFGAAHSMYVERSDRFRVTLVFPLDDDR